MIKVEVNPGIYSTEYESIDDCVTNTFYHKQPNDVAEKFVLIAGDTYILIPKCATRSLLAIGEKIDKPSGKVYAFIRNSVDRVLSAKQYIKSWSKIPLEQFVEELEDSNFSELDVHLRSQVDLINQMVGDNTIVTKIKFEDINKHFDSKNIFLPRRNESSKKHNSIDSIIKQRILSLYIKDYEAYNKETLDKF